MFRMVSKGASLCSKNGLNMPDAPLIAAHPVDGSPLCLSRSLQAGDFGTLIVARLQLRRSCRNSA